MRKADILLHEGRAGGLILQHSPHRVFITPLARAEVYQAIPPAHGKSPDGPHTHVLFDLLKHKRTHAATEPIPDHYVPCAHLYPAHPAKDAQGYPQSYCPKRKEAFDRILTRFGDERTLRFKQEVTTAIAMGLGPSAVRSQGRFARTTVRVALRQLRAAGADAAPLRTGSLLMSRACARSARTSTTFIIARLRRTFPQREPRPSGSIRCTMGGLALASAHLLHARNHAFYLNPSVL